MLLFCSINCAFGSEDRLRFFEHSHLNKAGYGQNCGSPVSNWTFNPNCDTLNTRVIRNCHAEGIDYGPERTTYC